MKYPAAYHCPDFDPASLLFRLRERNPAFPLVHIDRERATGWSYVPVAISSVLEESGNGSRLWRAGHSDPVPSESRWEDHPLLSRPLFLEPDLNDAFRQSGRQGPSFTSGVVLLLPFEMGELWEPSGGLFSSPRVPAFLCDCREVVAFHAPTGRVFLPSGFDRTLLRPVDFSAPPPVRLKTSCDRDGFSALMDPIRESLKCGDYFQLNIALDFRSPLPEGFDPLALYFRMRRRSPSLFGGFFSFGNHFLLSHSPEQLLSMDGRSVRTLPIAGTAKGEVSAEEEEPLRQEAKLLAEHIMIVDLLRNDIGRVSVPGSVRVPRFLAIETYPHLRHLVSEVTGEVDKRFSRSDVIKSLFPGGSVTGAPRIRVRKHTSILEREPRNYYCGSLGFVSDSGVLDLSLLIRTLEGEREGKSGTLTLKAGAGIVADSDVDDEFGEIMLKAQAIREMLIS